MSYLLKAYCCFFLLSGLVISSANADWTGISLSIDEIESEWTFEADQRVSDTTRLNLHFEETTRSGVGVGANIGRLTTRISNSVGPRNIEKYDASYIGVFIRYPYSFGESFQWHNKLGYQYHAGSGNDDSNEDSIEWRDISYEVGLSARIGDLRIMPFARVSDVSGDIDRDSGTESFDNDETVSSGLSIDLFVDSTSFISLKFTSSGDDTFSLRFAREF